MAFSICITNGFITDAEIIARLERTIPVQAAHIQAVENLMANRESYTNEAVDVLSSAYRAIGRTVTRDFEAAWVDAMLAG